MRRPAVDGQFYAASKKDLIKQIEQCFTHELGPGKIPEVTPSPKRKIKGLVVPHAGYPYSGPVAAYSYYQLAEDGFPESFVIIGPNHSGLGSMVALTTEDFKMPLGDVKIDQKLAKLIQKGIIDNDLTAHNREHSIEVQLPFLQYFNHDFKFVPITLGMQDYKTSSEVGEIVAEAIKESGRDTVIIASSDFTHCGFMYGQIPPSGQSAGGWAAEQDKKAINEITSLNPKGLLKSVRQFDITMCGYGPIMAMLNATMKLDAKDAILLKYASSYDIHPADSAVGYGAIAIV
jgi:AmmeMemoRadiSam system protein B